MFPRAIFLLGVVGATTTRRTSRPSGALLAYGVLGPRHHDLGEKEGTYQHPSIDQGECMMGEGCALP